MKLNKLKNRFNKVALIYIDKFCKKHDLTFSGAVEDDDFYSHLLFIDEIVITLEDVITDLELNLQPSLLFDWWYNEIDTKQSYSFFLRSLLFDSKDTANSSNRLLTDKTPF